MKKISLIITSLVFCIAAVFVFPAKEAQANPLAVGGALYLGGAGVYVVGAVAVAGIAGLAGCESCQEDIEAHAQRTWDGSTQVVKDGVQLMIDASVGAWGATSSALTSVDANVNTWVDGQISSIANAAMYSKYAYDPVTFNGADYNLFIGGQDKSIAYKNVGASGFIVDGRTFNSMQVVHANGYWIQAAFNHPTIVNTASYSSPYIEKSKEPQIYAEMVAIYNAITTTSNPNTVINLAKAMGVSFGYGAIQTFNTDYANVTANATEAWEEMTDAGLVLPTDNARPMAGDMPLTYDPVTDAYSGIDGVNVPREDITGYDYGKPHWKTLEDLAMLGLSGLGAGLYIDGWPSADSITSTYNPTTDATTTTTSGTTTNVTTGETSVTSTTTTSTGDTTGNPPVDVPPTTPPKTGEPLNPFNAKPMPIAAITGLFQLLAALIFYLIRLFTFIATLALIAPTPIDNPYFIWFTTATFQGITPYPLVQNLALFFLGFSVYRSVRRVFG